MNPNIMQPNGRSCPTTIVGIPVDFALVRFFTDSFRQTAS